MLSKVNFIGVLMQEIETKIVEINREKRIALIFTFNDKLISEVKQLEGRIWDEKEKFWHIPYRDDTIANFNNRFSGKFKFIPEIETSAKPQIPHIYQETLKQENYSSPTIKTYTQHFKMFLNYFPDKTLEKLGEDEIRTYIIYLVKEKHYSQSAQNNAINAIKYYYVHVLHRELEDYYLPRPRKARTIPKILNEKEVILIFKQINEIRDRCMIGLIYSAGLTPSEIIYLKRHHIQFNSMKIYISSPREGEGRFVVLADKVKNFLKEYFTKYNPEVWLFESHPGSQYSRRKLQRAFKEAVVESGITKPATLTILKNSFAVHLIEKGVDIRFIQEMMGHKHSKTTMKYLRVSKRDLKTIKSPLDNLDI